MTNFISSWQDAIQLLTFAGMVGQALVYAYRIKELEKSVAALKEDYITKEVFDLTIANLRLELTQKEQHV